jgi:eukaryotic-like serine/threonine-protein kinase
MDETMQTMEAWTDSPEDVASRWTRLLSRHEATETLGSAETFVYGDGAVTAVSAPSPSGLPVLTVAAEQGDHQEFRFVDTLGQGGMGVVMLAKQASLGREVAVKMPIDEGFDEAEHLPAFLREARMIGHLEHPNIVPIYSLGRDERGRPMIVMKRISGHSWSDLLKRETGNTERSREERLEFHLQILMQVCNAVGFAHSRGIIHRDLKPDNVMVGSFGEVYVLDWGIAVSLDPKRDERIPRAMDISGPSGTPAYMAPEMTTGRGEQLTVWTDVFLLGATLYEIIMGRPPYVGSTALATVLSAYQCDPPEFHADVPPELAAICEKAMARAPEARYASAEALKEALVGFLRHRESARLAREARVRLEELRSRLEDSQGGLAQEETLTINRLFGECRFAFEAALRDWPENEAARNGQRETTLLMATHELEQGNVRAAATILAGLEEVPLDLQERLARAEKDQRAREARLRRLERDVDRDLGKSVRGWLALAIGVFWSTLWGYRYTKLVEGSYTLTPELYFIQHGSLVVFVVVATAVGWRKFAANAVGRRLMLGLIFVLMMLWMHRLVSLKLELDIYDALTVELILLAMGSGLLAIAGDLRVFVTTAAYTLAAVLTIYSPVDAFLIYGLSHAAALCPLAVLWIRQKD